MTDLLTYAASLAPQFSHALVLAIGGIVAVLVVTLTAKGWVR